MKPGSASDPQTAFLDAVAAFAAIDLPGRSLLSVRIKLDDGGRVKLKRNRAGAWTLTIEVSTRRP